jgi:NAD(P)-dependent dehydrogenase (short-subunit alcohol dehydrogenase family)
MIKSAAWLKKKIPEQTGRRILISGGTSGIGYEAALALCYRGAEVVIACRNPEKAKKTEMAIKAEVPSAKLGFVYYDQSVPSFIAQLGQELAKEPFDAIVLNAGVYYPEKGACATDGTSLTFQTNAVGTSLLFQALYPSHPKSRYVFVNSIANKRPRHGDFASYLGGDSYSRNEEYMVSKRAVMSLFGVAMMTYDCDATLTHPGVTRSDILRKFAPWIKKLGNGFLYLFTHKPWKACLGIVYLASGLGQRGDYLVPRGPFHISGYPKKTKLPKRRVFGESESFRRLFLSHDGI